MRAVIDQLPADVEIGLAGFGQSNRLPRGDRDTEGYVQAPHLQLRAAGLDLTIQAMAPALSSGHGAIGTRSVVTVCEALLRDDWKNGEFRLVQAEYGDGTFSTRRKGYAKVINNQANASTTTATYAVALSGVFVDLSTDVITWPNHGRADGSQVYFTSTGTLMTGVTSAVPMYVRDATQHTFKVSSIPFGTAANLGGAPTGTMTITALPYLLVEWLSEVLAPTVGVTFANATELVTHTAHNLPEGAMVVYTGGTPPPEVTLGVTYFVRAPITANTYRISATQTSAVIVFSADSSGTITATPGGLVYISGYVHLQDRFNSYDNVQVVTPYMPIEPGPYPTGTPLVPGITLDADVTAYSDLALVLPFAWNEGIDGEGEVGLVQVAALVCTLQGGQTITDNLYAGGYARVGSSKGRIVSNTTTTVTVDAWVGGQPPAATNLAFEIHLGHHRNNPHHFTAGEGFLYPSACSQPGGHELALLNGSTVPLGQTYSRPRDRLIGSYVRRVLADQACSPGTNFAGLARSIASSPALFQCSINSGKLRVTRTDTSRSPGTGLLQFEDFIRVGHVVVFNNMNQSPSIDGIAWRVTALKYTDDVAGGSYIECDALDTSYAVPAAISGAEPSGAIAQRQFYKPLHQFGSLIESSWRIANAIGRRLVVTCLGVNAAGIVTASGNNDTGFPGQIGWWDDDLDKDWSPSNPDGVAARFERLLGFIAPRAVHASLGASKSLKVLAIDGWAFESDSITAAGRELISRTVPAEIQWIRGILDRNSLNPYPVDARVPVHLAQLPAIPWEIVDTGGLVNAAIARAVMLEGGFMASYNTDASAKQADLIHFTGVAEAIHGKAVADLLLPMIEFGFLFAMGKGAIGVANGAMNLLGDAPNVTQLEPTPNGTAQAIQCAAVLPGVRDVVLQHHPWSFCRVRIAPSLLGSEDTVATWTYAYALPADCLHIFKVLDPTATDDLQIGSTQGPPPGDLQIPSSASAVQNLFRSSVPSTQVVDANQPHSIETNRDGYRVLRTDQQDAVILYASRARPFDLWDPMAILATKHRLASELAGGTIKGKEGRANASEFLRASELLMAQAKGQNAEYQEKRILRKPCPWLP